MGRLRSVSLRFGGLERRVTPFVDACVVAIADSHLRIEMIDGLRCIYDKDSEDISFVNEQWFQPLDAQHPSDPLTRGNEVDSLRAHGQELALGAPATQVDDLSVSGDEELRSPSESPMKSTQGDPPERKTASLKAPPYSFAKARIAQSHVAAVVSPIQVSTTRDEAEPGSGPAREPKERDTPALVHPAEVQVLSSTM